MTGADERHVRDHHEPVTGSTGEWSPTLQYAVRASEWPADGN